MNILVTNDDGIDAPGLWVLAGAMNKVGKVLVAAPDSQRSGAGTSVTMTRGERVVTEVPSQIPGIQAFAVEGTPCDCVFWGLRKMRQTRTDMVVSGVNLGPNMGFDISFSGTVSATIASYIMGIPAMAVSLVIKSYKEETHFDMAGHIAESLVRSINTGDMKTGSVLNVNVPNIPPENIKGALVTRSARLWYVNLLRSSESNAPTSEKLVLEEGTDVWAVNKDYISITPLHFNVTHEAMLPDISKCVQDMDYKLHR